MIKSLVLIFASAAALSLVSVAQMATAQAATDQKANEFVLCKHQKDVRTIRVMPTDKDSCAITYTKRGLDEVVGSSRSANACHSILKSIKGNLEASKWSCRSVRSASTTTSSEAKLQ
jgi:hypothetical protein